MIGIDLFAGAGGMTLGAKLSGIDVRYAVEIDKYAAETYQFNNPEVTIFNKDIKKVKTEIFNVEEKLVLFGGPPCQGFSVSNSKTRNKENPKNWLFKEFFRFAKTIRPNWIVIENVTGIKETEGGYFLEKILNELDRLGYLVTHNVLTASDYGVPQSRNRYFIVANSNNIDFEFPKPFQNIVTVYEAIGDLPDLPNGHTISRMNYKTNHPHSTFTNQMRNGVEYVYNNLVTMNAPHIIKRYKHIPQGGNWENIPKRLMKNYSDRERCHTGIYHRLIESEPAKVIGNFRKNMLVHPRQDRGLSVREAARLQSFPDYYIFMGSIGYQQQQVADAVPPLLAKAVFEQITLSDASI